MKIFELVKWSISHHMEDKWYVSVNGDSDPTVYKMESVEQILGDFRSEEIHVIHVTQTPINGLEGWVKLESQSSPGLESSFTQNQESQESLADENFIPQKEAEEVWYEGDESLVTSTLAKIKKMGLAKRCYFVSGFMLFLALLFHLGYKKSPDENWRSGTTKYELQMKGIEDYRFARNTTLFLATGVFITAFLITGKKNDAPELEQINNREAESLKGKRIPKNKLEIIVLNKIIQKDLLISVGGIIIVFILDEIIPSRGSGKIFKGLVFVVAAAILIPLIHAGKLFFLKRQLQKELE
jgi:hypothetical protein